MGVLEPIVRPQRTADQGALRVRRTLAMTFRQIESSLSQIRQIMETHGDKQIWSALGRDAEEVEKLYQALKGVLETSKPNAKISDLPRRP